MSDYELIQTVWSYIHDIKEQYDQQFSQNSLIMSSWQDRI